MGDGDFFGISRAGNVTFIFLGFDDPHSNFRLVSLNFN